MKRYTGTILFVILAIGAVDVVCQGRVQLTLQSPTPSILAAARDAFHELPEFIPTVRAYGGAGFDDFQRSSMKELGLDYVQGLVDFTWGNIERGDNVWKWIATDEQMDQLGKSGLKVVAFLLCPKSPGLPWEDWFVRAFALRPKFDWFGLHTYHTPVTGLESPGAYAGVVGLMNVRKFLDAHGYADKPLWLNEGGFNCGEDLGGLPEQTHAEQVAETYIVARTLNVNLKGWVYFEYFSKTHLFEESSADPGLMTSLDQHKPPQPRQAWLALQTLIKTVRFFDCDFDAKISGQYNEPVPAFVYRFRGHDKPSSRLWVVFSGQGMGKRPPVRQDVTIRIAPATQASLIDMLGKSIVVHADSSGDVTVTASSSPQYLKTTE